MSSGAGLATGLDIGGKEILQTVPQPEPVQSGSGDGEAEQSGQFVHTDVLLSQHGPSLGYQYRGQVVLASSGVGQRLHCAC